MLPNGHIFEFKFQMKMEFEIGMKKVYHVTYLWKALDEQSLDLPSPLNFDHVCESYGGPKNEKVGSHLFGREKWSTPPSYKPNILVHMAHSYLLVP